MIERKITRIAIFSSGSGSNAQKIIEHFQKHPLIDVEVLMSNNPKAYALDRAKALGIPSRVFNRDEFYKTTAIVDELKQLDISWIVLAGFLWLVPEQLVNAFPDRIINIHPALLPKYGGKGMYGMHVHKAVIDAGDKESGISIHFVNPIYDEGKLVFQASCEVDKNDTPEQVSKKVQELEHRHFPKIIEKLIIESSREI